MKIYLNTINGKSSADVQVYSKIMQRNRIYNGVIKLISIRLSMLLVILLSSLTLFAQQGVKWETASFEQSIKKAQKTGKMIFMDCYTSWCGPCKWMTENVFPTKTAGDYFNKNFVCTKFDMEKGEGLDLRSRYGVKAYPTFLILDQNGNELGRLLGKNEVDVFIANIKTLLDPDNSPQVLENKLKESGNIMYAYKYISVMSDLDQHDYSGYILNKYWNDLKPGCKYYRQNLQYLPKAIKLTTPTVFYDILNNKSEYDRHFGKPIVDRILIDGLSEDLAYFFSAPKMNNKETVTPEAMEKAYSIVNLLASDNYFLQFLSTAVKAKLTNNIDELVKMLDANKMASNLYPQQIMHIRMMLREFNVPETAKAKFVRNLRNFYQNQLKTLESDLEKYKDVVISE